MSTYNITPEEMKGILDFLNGESGTSVLGTPQAAVFMAAANELRRRGDTALRNCRNEIERLRRRVDALNARLGKDPGNAEFTDLGIDSVDMAKMICFYIRKQTAHLAGTYYIKRSVVITLLFQAYSGWLGKNSERICMEHPVATEYGPQFWRAYGKLDPAAELTDDDRRQLTEIGEKHPGLTAYVRNMVAKYLDAGIKELSDYHKSGFPYRNAERECREVGRWNTEIKDSDIYAWKNS